MQAITQMYHCKWRLQGGQEGFVLIESMGSMLFYLMMLATAAILLVTLFSDSKLSEAQSSLSSMRMKTIQIFTGSNNYDGLDNDFGIKSGIVPKKMQRGTGVSNPWGGAVIIAPGTDNTTFVITLSGVPEKECVGLATFQAETWESIQVNGSEVPRTAGVGEAGAFCSGESNVLAYAGR